VIVGPRADKLQTGPARVRFSFCRSPSHVWNKPAQLHDAARDGQTHDFVSATSCCLHVRKSGLSLHASNEHREDHKMAWTTPTLVEICIGLEINGYLPAEF